MLEHYAHSRHGQGLAFQQLSLLRGCHLSRERSWLMIYQQPGEVVQRSCYDQLLKTLMKVRGYLVLSEQAVRYLFHARRASV
jgi:hypothetical protein